MLFPNGNVERTCVDNISSRGYIKTAVRNIILTSYASTAIIDGFLITVQDGVTSSVKGAISYIVVFDQPQHVDYCYPSTVAFKLSYTLCSAVALARLC